MYYPLCLSTAETRPFPLFAGQLEGEPHVFNFSGENARTDYGIDDFSTMQALVFGEMKNAGRSWGVGRYLENRRGMLSGFPQMVRDGRFFHAGLDIALPAGSQLFAPLRGRVHFAGIDAGPGNYGGVVVLEHQARDARFFSLYGHLSTPHGIKEGETLMPGDAFATLGEGEDSGGWFTHVHLQILTPRAIEQGRMLEGYVAASELPRLMNLFPPPYSLFVRD